jgi:Ca2+-binding EF-hand superfamily protein
MVRTGLRIAAKDVSDEDINMLIESLDNDGGGTLDLSELADFVVRGYAALLSSKCK